MEIVKSNKSNWLVFLLSLGFLLLANLLTAQMSVQRSVSYNEFNDKELTRRYPSYYLKFKEGNDTTVMSIYSDSLSVGSMNGKIYVYYPKGKDIQVASLKITFNDGTVESFPFFKKEGNYAEYRLPQFSFMKLYTKAVRFVYFNNEILPFEIKDDYYFYAFLRKLS